MLNLPNVVITGRDEDEESCLIHAESEATVRLCPGCGSFNSVVIGSRNQPFVDTQMHAKTVRILFTRKRLKCKDCGKTYFEPLEWLHEDFRMPTRTVDYINKPRPEPTEMILIEEPELFLHGTRIDMPVPPFELVADHTDTHNQS